MIYLELLWGFLQVGCLAFGGAYAAIPFIRDVVVSYNWLSDTDVAYIIAISESTPGPIMVNMATYVGQMQGGFWGAFIATAAVVTPAFLITILIMALLHNLLQNRWVRTCLRGLMPCIASTITATGLVMLAKAIYVPRCDLLLAWKIIFALFLVAVEYGYKKRQQRKISPIVLIVIAALGGMIIF